MSSRHKDAATEIRRLFKSVWEASAMASVPVDTLNRRFKEPQDSPWVRLSVLPAETIATAIGGPTPTRTPFFMQLQVFLPENTGTDAARQAADIIGDGMNGRQIKVPGLLVKFDHASIANGPPEPGYTTFLVTIGGHYDADPQI